MDEWASIRFLRVKGISIRAIAKQLGISRNTVRRALAEDEPPEYKRATKVNPQLEPFTEVIREMYYKKHFIGTRILRELRQLGYQGSQSAFYRHLKRIAAEKPSDKVSERYETAPGQQAQFDWSTYTVNLGGIMTKVIVYGLVLGYSRRKHYWASLDETQASIFEAIEEGFWHFGGTTKELLIDNPKAFVVNPNPQSFQWNRRFLEFCGHYRVQPVACRVGRPRTKGKVERPFYYLEEHFIKGREFENFEHFCRELERFESEELDLLVHSTTQERPIDRFERERAVLTPLPTGRFVGTQEQFRKVSWDCLISFEGSRYSVPYQYAGKQVWVRTSQGVKLLVRDQEGKLIASHPLSSRKGAIILVEDHYRGLRKGTPKTRALLEQAFLERFPQQQIFLEKLYAQQKMNLVIHLRSILALAENYPAKTMEKAFSLALEYNTFSHSFIAGLLEQENPLEIPPERGPAPIVGLPSISIKPDLSVYQDLLSGGNGHD